MMLFTLNASRVPAHETGPREPFSGDLFREKEIDAHEIRPSFDVAALARADL
jgi:hypothetical protein